MQLRTARLCLDCEELHQMGLIRKDEVADLIDRPLILEPELTMEHIGIDWAAAPVKIIEMGLGNSSGDDFKLMS